MQYSIMEALFEGKIIPWERQNSYSSERLALEDKIESEKRYFTKKMSSDDCERFQTLEDLYLEATFDEQVGIYSHGFTLGALLMMEIMAKGDELKNK